MKCQDCTTVNGEKILCGICLSKRGPKPGDMGFVFDYTQYTEIAVEIAPNGESEFIKLTNHDGNEFYANAEVLYRAAKWARSVERQQDKRTK